MAFPFSLLHPNSPAWGAIQTLALKISGAGLALLMFNQAARVLGEVSFGHLAVWFNVASFLAVCAVFGQDTLIVRHAGEFGSGRDKGRARGAYAYGWMVAGFMAAGVSLMLVLLGSWGVIPLDGMAIYAVAAFVLMQTLLHYASHACRTLVHFRLAEFCREIIWRCVVLGVLWWCVFYGVVYREPVFFFSAAAGMGFAVVLQTVFIHRAGRLLWGDAPRVRDTMLWGKRSLGLWSSASFEAASQYIDVVLIGVLVHPAAAGGYFVAVRIANVFPMISSGLHTFLASRMAAHFYDGEQERLQSAIRHVMAVALVCVLALLFVLVMWGSALLALFGEEYRTMYWPLLILGAGTAFYALTGCHSVLLLTTGHEALYLKACVVFFVLRMLALLGLVPFLGVWGCALAWAGTVIPLGLLLVHLCRKHVQVDPSVMALLRSS